MLRSRKILKRLNNGFTVWLGGRCVRKLFGRVLVPVFWLGCFRVLDLLPLVPVGGFLVVGIVNLGRGAEVGRLSAVVHHMIVNVDLVRVVWADNQPEKVRPLVLEKLLEQRTLFSLQFLHMLLFD